MVGRMASEQTTWGTGVNAEAIAAWDGPLFDRFVRFRHIVTTGLGSHGDEALRLYPPQAGERVLDIGCGFGDTTQQIAALVGPEGEAVGVDAAPRFIEAAVSEAAEAQVRNARFAGRRRRAGAARRAALRPRVLPLRDDVLRQPRRGAAQRARRARARRRADDGRVAAAGRQRVALPRAADRRAVRAAPRGVRRAHLRARPVLDGGRRHDERRPAARRLHRHRLPSL